MKFMLLSFFIHRLASTCVQHRRRFKFRLLLLSRIQHQGAINFIWSQSSAILSLTHSLLYSLLVFFCLRLIVAFCEKFSSRRASWKFIIIVVCFPKKKLSNKNANLENFFFFEQNWALKQNSQNTKKNWNSRALEGMNNRDYEMELTCCYAINYKW